MVNIIIEHDNIIYMSDIPFIGGTSTFVYEMVKKYYKKDIAVVYRTIDVRQLERIKKYCKTYQLKPADEIKCKVCIINYDTSEIKQISEDAKIYMVIHADYTDSAYKVYPQWNNPRITGIISITKTIQKKMKDNFDIESIVSYNPLEVEQSKRLKLVSATRLSAIKGKERMITLAQELDKQNIDYIWYIFTDDKNEIKNDKIIYLNPRLDVVKWMQECDYVVQLSDTEALSYTINEALYSNVPVIVTPLPYLEEIGVKDCENAYILNFNCDNVEDVVKKMINVPKFDFKKLEDSYENILAKGERKVVDLNKKYKVKALDTYEKFNIIDSMLNKVPKAGEEFIVDRARLDILTGENERGLIFVDIIEEIKEEKKLKIDENEKPNLEEVKKEMKKRTTRKKKVDE